MLQKIIIIFVLLTTITISIFFYFNNEVNEQKLNNIVDQMRLTIAAQLKTHQMNDLKVAILLSKNEALVNALEDEYSLRISIVEFLTDIGYQKGFCDYIRKPFDIEELELRISQNKSNFTLISHFKVILHPNIYRRNF